MRKNSGKTILAVHLFVWCLLEYGVTVSAQETFVATGGPVPDGTNVTVAVGAQVVGGGAMMSINGVDIGTILLEACDQNQDGKVTLAELKSTADSYFQLWDTNSDGSLSAGELTAGLQTLFPSPPPGGAQAVALVNGVAVQVPPDEMPNPPQIISSNIMAQADANKDGLLSAQELNNWLSTSFTNWDQNGAGALDTQELDVAFSQLARPDN